MILISFSKKFQNPNLLFYRFLKLKTVDQILEFPLLKNGHTLP
jgi:hypothetical protein